MAVPSYMIVGRSRDCELVLSDPSVSGRHARLSWRQGALWVEDLGSANGTFVRGERIAEAAIRPGDDVRLGNALLPWSDRRLKPFLRAGARGDTVVGVPVAGHRFICGACGQRGVLPPRPERELRCGSCGATLHLGKRQGRLGLGLFAAVGVVAVAIGGGWALFSSDSAGALGKAAERLGIGGDEPPRTRSREEQSVRIHTAPKVRAAVDYDAPLTRNTAVRIAADDQGPFHVEQVARIWTHVRERWRYVNDPRGGEYFARASETIENDYAGDCDDFAIVLAAMITSIGGQARVVMMDGPAGGHAYTEACIDGDPEQTAQTISNHYRRGRDRRFDQIHFRESDDCPVWLNLDWNAGMPGGPYGGEAWAVAIYVDGRTEALAAAPGPAGGLRPSDEPGASAPPR